MTEVLRLQYDGVPLKIVTEEVEDELEPETRPKRGEPISYDGTGWFVTLPDGTIDYEYLHETREAQKIGDSVQAAEDYRALRNSPKPQFTIGSYWNESTKHLWKGYAPSDLKDGSKPKQVRQTTIPTKWIPLQHEHTMPITSSPLKELGPDTTRKGFTLGSPATKPEMWPQKKKNKDR
jgi:hypothetical protein